jgi:hypothetical protein
VHVGDDAAGLGGIEREIDQRVHTPAAAVAKLPGKPLRQTSACRLPAPLPALGGEGAVCLQLRTEIEERLADERAGVDAHEPREALVAAVDRVGQMHDTVDFFEG